MSAQQKPYEKAPFSPLFACPKCGATDGKREYVEYVYCDSDNYRCLDFAGSHYRRRIDPSLRVTCRVCEYTYLMQTKDEACDPDL